MSTFQYGANVHANGIRQHYLRYGGRSGGRDRLDPVIVLPGITSPAITWGFVGERLGEIYDCYVLDSRGRGLSSAGDELDYSLDAQAADVAAFVQALGFERFSVLGHSMGARIAVRLMRQRVVRPTRLVLVEPPMSGPRRRPYPAEPAQYFSAIEEARRGCDIEAIRAQFPTWSESHLRLRAEWLHTCDPRAVRASFDGFSNDDIHADLHLIDMPAMLMVAADAQVVLESDIDEWQGLVPQLVVKRVSHAGHMIPMDNEPGFYRELGDFLGAHVPV